MPQQSAAGSEQMEAVWSQEVQLMKLMNSGEGAGNNLRCIPDKIVR